MTVIRLPRKIQPGLSLLLEASQYAEESSCDPWDFAVEIARLHAAGLNYSDFRWLVHKGYVSHAEEITQAGQQGRCFRLGGDLTFTARECFVLTESGIAVASQFFDLASAETPFAGDDRVSEVYEAAEINVPHWDKVSRELTLGRVVLKRFRVPAPNQELILSAFEEEDWPFRIDDPLPRRGQTQPKERLRMTIHSLNRNMTTRALHFHGDGTGSGVCWELTGWQQGGSTRRRRPS